MSFPSIKIQFIGTTCTCCSGNSSADEYKVVYNTTKDNFQAIPTDLVQKTADVIFSTWRALDSTIHKIYALRLDEISIGLSDDDLPSLEEVRKIESVALEAVKERARKV